MPTRLLRITGGPCDGLGGGDAPFVLVTKIKKPKRATMVRMARTGNVDRAAVHTPSVRFNGGLKLRNSRTVTECAA